MSNRLAALHCPHCSLILQGPDNKHMNQRREIALQKHINELHLHEELRRRHPQSYAAILEPRTK